MEQGPNYLLLACRIYLKKVHKFSRKCYSKPEKQTSLRKNLTRLISHSPIIIGKMFWSSYKII